MAQVDVFVKNSAIFVKINGSLHLRVLIPKIVAIHSWHYDDNYFIEFVLNDNHSFLVEHDSRETWIDILAGLEKVEWNV